jgi:hypothetical protein
MAQRIVHQVVQVLAPGCVPLFLTDGFKLTFRTLFRTFEAILEEPPAERGAGATYRLLHAL